MGRLKHEKAVLQRTLLAAGLPFPQLPTDLAPPQEWTGVTPLGLPTMAPASLPHIATPNSAYSAFSVPSTSQAPQATGFKPCQQNPSMSQGHYVVPMSAPLNGLPRPSISQALPFTALNGIGEQVAGILAERCAIPNICAKANSVLARRGLELSVDVYPSEVLREEEAGYCTLLGSPCQANNQE